MQASSIRATQGPVTFCPVSAGSFSVSLVVSLGSRQVPPSDG